MGGRWLAFGLNMPQAVSVFANDQLAWPESQRSLTELLHPRYRVPPVPTSTFAPPGAPQRRGIPEGKTPEDTASFGMSRHQFGPCSFVIVTGACQASGAPDPPRQDPLVTPIPMVLRSKLTRDPVDTQFSSWCGESISESMPQGDSRSK